MYVVGGEGGGVHAFRWDGSWYTAKTIIAESASNRVDMKEVVNGDV